MCWLLSVLFGNPDLAPHLVFKGGTSLSKVPDAYRRYLEHFFADAFKLRGTPLRIQFKTGVNPYADARGRR